MRHYVLDPRQRNVHLFHLGAYLCPPVPEAVAWVEGHRARGRAILVGAMAADDNPSVVALRERERIPVTVIPGWDEPDGPFGE